LFLPLFASSPPTTGVFLWVVVVAGLNPFGIGNTDRVFPAIGQFHKEKYPFRKAACAKKTRWVHILTGGLSSGICAPFGIIGLFRCHQNLTDRSFNPIKNYLTLNKEPII